VTMAEYPLLEVDALHKSFSGRASVVDWLGRKRSSSLVAVDGVSFAIERGETVGIVGESGSGKTTLARCLVRLTEPDAGRINFDGLDVLDASPRELRAIRRRMQLIYQDPYSSLNPRQSVSSAISEPARAHSLVPDRDQARSLVRELLDLVGMPRAVESMRPRELSGGQRQRVAIARALSLKPELLIADEPVSALDVSVQAQILNLLEDLNRQLGLTTIFIAHQLAVIAHLCQRVMIMYLGRVVETGPTGEVFVNPRHPYTQALLAAHPQIETRRRHRKPALRGDIPSGFAIPSGCRFRTRCWAAVDACQNVDPAPTEVASGHVAWCHVLPIRQPQAGEDVAR
jgi:oligopeptide/dipeptide ABC transporter ATP-binding protein